jgi:hypothetical protein
MLRFNDGMTFDTSGELQGSTKNEMTSAKR